MVAVVAQAGGLPSKETLGGEDASALAESKGALRLELGVQADRLRPQAIATMPKITLDLMSTPLTLIPLVLIQSFLMLQAYLLSSRVDLCIICDLDNDL